jgi:hypothetical protein
MFFIFNINVIFRYYVIYFEVVTQNYKLFKNQIGIHPHKLYQMLVGQ